MENNIGNITKVIYRIKYTHNVLSDISNNAISQLLIMEEEFKRFVESIDMSFKSGGYMDIWKYENERYFFVVASYLNPLNIKELLNSVTRETSISLLKIAETELVLNQLKRKNYIDSNASKLFILEDEPEEEVNMDTFLNYIIEEYKSYTSSYYGNTQDIIKLYDEFNVLNYWQSTIISNHKCYSILYLIIAKILCLE